MMTIRKRDALETLTNVKDNSADLILLDPYYNEWEEWIEKGIIDLCFQKLSESGNLLCFTAQPFDFELRKTLHKNFRREIIWHIPKRPKWVSNALPLVNYQKIFWAVKNKDRLNFFQPRTGLDYSPHTQTGNKGHMVFRDFKGKLRPFEKHPEGIWLNDVLSFDKPHKPDKEGGKPIELIEVLLRCFCPEDGLVVDPFAGTGTTCFACENLDLSCIAGDIDFSVLSGVKEEIKTLQSLKEIGLRH